MGLIEITGFTSHGSKDPAAGTERLRWYCERLEDGDILVAAAIPGHQRAGPRLPHRRAPGRIVVGQNISYEPANQRLRGYARSATDALRLKRVLHGYSEMTRTAIEKLLPSYAGAMEIDFTSFRPLEEQGRPLRGRSRNDLIHVDAFPTRPARGRRILRFFTNVHRAKPRVWNTSQTFEDLAAHMALDAGLIRYAASAGGLAGGLRKALTAAARGAGIAIAERAPYDQFMLRFHDYLKANQDFQRECPKQRHEFPPGSSWIAFTDTVSHAVQSGQSALEQTFFVPVSSLIAPHKSPLRILESLAGRPIV